MAIEELKQRRSNTDLAALLRSIADDVEHLGYGSCELEYTADFTHARLKMTWATSETLADVFRKMVESGNKPQ